jgi:type IV secretory pathway VirB10-like protein
MPERALDRMSTQGTAAPDDVNLADHSHVLPEGSAVKLVLLDTVDSSTAAVGDRVTLSVGKDVLIDGVVLIPRGTKAVGIVSH